MNKFEIKGAVFMTVSLVLLMVMCIFVIEIDTTLFLLLMSNLLIMMIFITGLMIIWYGVMNDYKLTHMKLKCKNMLEELFKRPDNK